MIVESDAWTDDVDEGRAAMGDGGLEQRHELLLVAGKTAADESCAQLQRHPDHVDGGIRVHYAAFVLRSFVGGGGELTFRQPVNAVVLDEIDHVHAAPD